MDLEGLVRIALDIDGVMADFTTGFTKLAEELGITDHHWGPAEQPTWHFDFHMKPVWQEVDRCQNWWMSLEPLVTPGEVTELNQLIHNYGVEVVFITNRGPTSGLSAERQSGLWLEGIGVDMRQATVLCAGAGKKGALAAALDIDYAIDDNVANLEDLRNNGITTFARTWPYNESWDGPRVNYLMGFLGAVMY